MSDYTPTTDEVRGRHNEAASLDTLESYRVADAEFGRWLAAHDAEVREAVLAEAGEPEWEYGVTTKWGNHRSYTHLEDAEEYAHAVREAIRSGRDASGSLVYHGLVMKRTKAKPGPWLLVDQERRCDE